MIIGEGGGGAVEERVGEDTTLAGAEMEETTDLSSRTCDFSHTGRREQKTAKRTLQVTTGTAKNPFLRTFGASCNNSRNLKPSRASAR